MPEYGAYVDLDVHKEMIAVAVAWPGQMEPAYRGVISNNRAFPYRLIRDLRPDVEVIGLCYEASPRGYGLNRGIVASGHR